MASAPDLFHVVEQPRFEAGGVFRLALPDDEDVPAEVAERLQRALVAGDLLAACLAYLLAFLLRTAVPFPLTQGYLPPLRFAEVHHHWPEMLAAQMGALYFLGLYEARALTDPASIGQTYELYGPDVYTLKELVRMTARQMGLRRWVLPLPDALGRLQGFVFDFVPGKPFSSDNYRSLKTDSVGGVDGLHRLGIAPTPVSAVLPDILGDAADRQSRLDRNRANAH